MYKIRKDREEKELIGSRNRNEWEVNTRLIHVAFFYIGKKIMVKL